MADDASPSDQQPRQVLFHRELTGPVAACPQVFSSTLQIKKLKCKEPKLRSLTLFTQQVAAPGPRWL